MNVLEMQPLGHIRRNHGIEHATVHVLTEWDPDLSLVGRADAQGFNIYGEVDAETLASATQEALRRMNNGQGALAVHPRCGTQLVVMGAVTGLAAFLALGNRPRVSRLPDAILATTLAALVAQPLGLAIQRNVTTSSDVSQARFAGITPKTFLGLEFQHVDIHWEDGDPTRPTLTSPVSNL